MNPQLTGIELIAEERREQIEKHGFSIIDDAKYYQNRELIQAAEFCLLHADQPNESDGFWPAGWNIYFMNKILNKSTIGKLIVAGAFLMAENDRRGDKFWEFRINQIAAEIDRLNNTKADHEWLDETDESPSSDPVEVLVVALKEIASPISRLTKKEIKYLADEGLKAYEQLKQQQDGAK